MIDKDIELTHSFENGFSANWYSGTEQVSDLYVYKQYRAALQRINELENCLDAANFNELEQELFLQGTR